MYPSRKVMDRQSTRTPAERQDDEAERLVRPAPKYKPPRHDRRRERDDSDSEVDPDEVADRKDRSENYKTIGGSERLLLALEFPTQDALKKYLKDHPDADPAKHSVKETEDPEAEQQEPPEDEAEGEEEVEEEAQAEPDFAALSQQIHGLAKTDEGLKSQFKSFKPGQFYDGMAQQNPDFPISRLPWSKQLPKELQGLTISQFQKAVQTKAPPGKTPSQPPGKTPSQPPKAAPPEAPEAPQPADGKPEGGQSGKPPAPAPEAKEKLLKPPSKPVRDNYDSEEEYAESQALYEKSLADFKQAVEAKKATKPKRKDFASEEEFAAAVAQHRQMMAEADKALQPPSEPIKPPVSPEAKKVAPPQPKRAKFSQSEQRAAVTALVSAVGPDTAKILVRTSGHPQDIRNFVSYYQAMASRPEKDVGSYAAKVAGFYQTDPSKVPPPKTGRNAAGDTVPFESLTPDEQAEAHRTHQLRTVAISVAAERGVKAAIAKNLPKGVDSEVAGQLAAALLQPVGPGREKWAEQAADQAYKSALGKPGVGVPPEQVKALMASLGDNPDAQKIAVSYLQAQDYNIAKQSFLTSTKKQGPGFFAGVGNFLLSLLHEDDDFEPDDDDDEGDSDPIQPITEWSSPREIGKSLAAAEDFMQARAKLYPPGVKQDRDPSSQFRQEVLGKIRSLAPAKYEETQKILEKQDIQNYDRKLKAYYQEVGDWEVERDLALQGLADPEDKEAAEWAYRQRNPQPTEPIKPANYDLVKNPKKVRDMRKWLLAEQFQQFGDKTASRVAAEFVISSYPASWVMASVSSGKTAVYHGVPPYGPGTPGQTDWQQPAQRDFGEIDWDLLLSSAKDWLKTPVLAMPMVGATRDTQLRAALDLAIYHGPYNGAVQPNNYNMLLARLAGADEHSTLLTQRVDTRLASDEIRNLAVKHASRNTALAYDLMALADRVDSK